MNNFRAFLFGSIVSAIASKAISVTRRSAEEERERRIAEYRRSYVTFLKDATNHLDFMKAASHDSVSLTPRELNESYYLTRELNLNEN